MSRQSILFADHCGICLELSDPWDDVVMYLSDSRVGNEQGAVMAEAVESELASDWTLRARLAIVAKIDRIVGCPRYCVTDFVDFELCVVRSGNQVY